MNNLLNFLSVLLNKSTNLLNIFTEPTNTDILIKITHHSFKILTVEMAPIKQTMESKYDLNNQFIYFILYYKHWTLVKIQEKETLSAVCAGIPQPNCYVRFCNKQ